ncbi:MAG: hydantoinase/oxoprolinase N-terminal domain-containing protein, partial [Novosphingobium sp.]
MARPAMARTRTCGLSTNGRAIGAKGWNRHMAAIVGIDVGGTFTDLYLSLGNGEPDRVVKVPSTPDDPSRGLADALDACGVDPQELGLI